jgi:hypothetical protein
LTQRLSLATNLGGIASSAGAQSVFTTRPREPRAVSGDGTFRAYDK